MDLIADGLLAAGALGAAFYCFILSRRLAKFNDLESGVGGAVAVLSAQVDDLTRALERARHGADQETEKLDELTHRAEAAAKQLELMMASMHDLPESTPVTRPSDASAPKTKNTSDAKPSEPMFSRTARRA